MRPKQIQGFRCREFGDGLQDLGPAGTRYRWRSSCPGGKSKHRMLCAQRTSGTGLGGFFLSESHPQVFCRSVSLTLHLLVRLSDQVLLDLDYVRHMDLGAQFSITSDLVLSSRSSATPRTPGERLRRGQGMGIAPGRRFEGKQDVNIGLGVCKECDVRFRCSLRNKRVAGETRYAGLDPCPLPLPRPIRSAYHRHASVGGESWLIVIVDVRLCIL
jgi:hypothetical protein